MLRIPLKMILMVCVLANLGLFGCASNPHNEFTQEVQSTARVFLDKTASSEAHGVDKKAIQDKLKRLTQQLEQKEFSTANRTAQQLQLDISNANRLIEIAKIKNNINVLEEEIQGLSKEMEWRTPLTLEQVLPLPESK